MCVESQNILALPAHPCFRQPRSGSKEVFKNIRYLVTSLYLLNNILLAAAYDAYKAIA